MEEALFMADLNRALCRKVTWERLVPSKPFFSIPSQNIAFSCKKDLL
jgi:hypothetical protein